LNCEDAVETLGRFADIDEVGKVDNVTNVTNLINERARYDCLMSRLPFRLIYDGEHAGDVNMARDEAISRAVSAGAQPPTLRFYGWAPAAISIGQAQKYDSIDHGACTQDGVGVVRRSTGGLAILHTDELTYSVALPKEHPIAGGDLMTSYRRIADAILVALDRLGVRDARASRVAREDKAKTGVCFEAPSDYEVVGAGRDGLIRKLVGSAQWRRVDGVMQHGSLPLTGDIARITRYLLDTPAPEAVREHAMTLEDATSQTLAWRAAAEVWAGAFADHLCLDLTEGALSMPESSAADVLLREKYGEPSWTRRR